MGVNIPNNIPEDVKKKIIDLQNLQIQLQNLKNTKEFLKIFSKEREFIKSLNLNNRIVDFFLFEDNTLLAILDKPSVEELSSINVLCVIGEKGEKVPHSGTT